MAYAYWKQGIAQKEAVFNLFFRNNPFKGGYTIACGLANAIDFLNAFRFLPDDLQFIKSLENNSGSKMFNADFIQFLAEMEFCCHVDAVPEGRVVFPNEPVVTVRGPILQAQLVESALLNIINYQSLVATKAARICQAAKDASVLEFGLRRAQGFDGALSGSRAAYIGGCHATSNVMASKVYGIPAIGTHAHSWVMAFDSELEAFHAYAEAMPDNCVFLIDTYDTLAGARNAIKVGNKLREKGKELLGVRIDSGDLAYLSIQVRKLLDDHGFEDTRIVASNDLDEYLVSSLKQQQSAIDSWGIGTRLITAYDQPAMGGVYKLAAILDDNHRWEYKIKLSEQAIKINNPGIQQVKRFEKNGYYYSDMIYDVSDKLPSPVEMIDPLDHTRRKSIALDTDHQDLLVAVYRSGELQYENPPIDEIQQKVKDELLMLDPGVKRLVNPHQYSVGLEKGLFDKKTELILNMRKP